MVNLTLFPREPELAFVCACIDVPLLTLYKDCRETADLHALLHDLAQGENLCVQ